MNTGAVGHAVTLPLALAAFLAGCGSTPPPPPTPESDAAHHDAPAGDDALAMVAARCAAVRNSPSLPVDCQLDAVDNIIRMQLTLANRNAAAQYGESAVRDIARPFCELANQASQPAAVVVALHEERVMQVADCATRQFSDWQPIDRGARELTAVSRACQSLQESSARVGCGMGLVDDKPSLIVSYAKGVIDDSGWSAISKRLAVPFCDATTGQGVEAVIYLIEDGKRAKAYNCATRAESAWVSIRKGASPSRQANRPSVPQREVWNTIK